MADEHNYNFLCDALTKQISDPEIVVTHWSGTEGVSRPYRFEITLAIKEPHLDLVPLLDQPATLTAKGPDGQVTTWNGIVTQASQGGSDEVYDFYQVVLEPRLVRLRSWHWSDIYLNKALDDIITQLLKNAGLVQPYVENGPCDYRILATGLAATRQDFVCQFEENCLDFLMRQLEFYGVYFWFEQSNNQEYVVFANDVSQQPQAAIPAVYYPRGQINPDAKEIAIMRLNRHVGLRAKTVTLHASPVYDNTTVNLTNTNPGTLATPIANSLGEHQLYSDHFEHLDGDSDISAATLMQWRTEEMLCQSLRVEGESQSVGLQSGHALTTYEYQRQGTASDYYIVQVSHQGYQTLETSAKTDEPPYRGQFIALPRWQDMDKNQTPLQFRPSRATPIPQIARIVNGFVDTETAGQPKRYAQIDDVGRYKVRFCFARQAYSGTHNSAWLRMATQYAGGASSKDLTPAGMHFPLREGTEVLIAFINGNPNRPVIVSALPNIEAPSVVNSKNSAEHAMVTPGGNRLVMSDSAEGTGLSGGDADTWVELYSPTCNSGLRLGTGDSTFSKGERGGYTTDPGFNLTTAGSGMVWADKHMQISVPGHLNITAGASTKGNFLSSVATNLPAGISVGATAGLVVSNYFGAKIESVEGLTMSHYWGAKVIATEAFTLESNFSGGAKFNLSVYAESNFAKTVTSKTFSHNFANLNLTGGKWTSNVGARKETVGTYDLSVTTAYSLEANTIQIKTTPRGGATLTLYDGVEPDTGSATLKSSANTIIKSKLATSMVGDTFSIATTGEEASLKGQSDGTMTLVGTMGISLTATENVDLNAGSNFTMGAPIVNIN